VEVGFRWLDYENSDLPVLLQKRNLENGLDRCVERKRTSMCVGKRGGYGFCTGGGKENNEIETKIDEQRRAIGRVRWGF